MILILQFIYISVNFLLQIIEEFEWIQNIYSSYSASALKRVKCSYLLIHFGKYKLNWMHFFTDVGNKS